MEREDEMEDERGLSILVRVSTGREGRPGRLKNEGKEGRVVGTGSTVEVEVEIGV